jgi:2-haloacid dehalogenase
VPRSSVQAAPRPFGSGYADFPDVAAAALSRYPLSDAQVADLMAGFAELPAMKALREGDVRVICLTNGPAQFTGAFLDRAGLRRYVERVVSVAEVRRWKPAAIVYHFAAEVAGVPASELALVAAHDWDCHGAKAAGLVTGFVRRESGGYNPLFLPPDVTGADLPEVCAALTGPQAPGAQTPGAQTPGAQTPGAQTPGAQTPGAQTPTNPDMSGGPSSMIR